MSAEEHTDSRTGTADRPAIRVFRTRRASTRGLESGTYFVRGTFRSATQVSTRRPGGGGPHPSHLLSEAREQAGELALTVSLRHRDRPRVTIEGSTIALERVGRYKFKGAVEGPYTSMRVEISCEPGRGRVVYVRSTRTESVTRKRFDFSNVFTGEKWHEYVELQQVINEELRFTARVTLGRAVGGLGTGSAATLPSVSRDPVETPTGASSRRSAG